MHEKGWSGPTIVPGTETFLIVDRPATRELRSSATYSQPLNRRPLGSAGGSMTISRLILGLTIVWSWGAVPAYACNEIGKTSPTEIVRQADAIVRAVAVEYSTPPRDPTIWTTGVPDSIVRFRIEEV